MKKEIVINASKDRSRIAIVEDGQLVELYIEHPDNVRTLGNIYLARIRKIMPAIKAAFVDIGQKQDAFLHFSDLTENLPELLALSGEKVPGYEAGHALAHAPQKRVADDETEPDIEDKLDFGTEEEKPQPSRGGRRRSRGRGGRSGSSRSSGRGGNRRRREEEEEEEERNEGKAKTAGSPFVIDLTAKTGKVSSGQSTTRGRDTSRDSAKDAAPNGSSPKPSSSKPSRRRDNARVDARSSEADASSDTPKEEPRETREKTEARSTSRRSQRAPEQDAPDTEADDTRSSGSNARADEDGGTSRRRGRRGRRGGRNRGRSSTTTEARGTDASEEASGETPAEDSKRGGRRGNRGSEDPGPGDREGNRRGRRGRSGEDPGPGDREGGGRGSEDPGPGDREDGGSGGGSEDPGPGDREGRTSGRRRGRGRGGSDNRQKQPKQDGAPDDGAPGEEPADTARETEAKDESRSRGRGRSKGGQRSRDDSRDKSDSQDKGDAREKSTRGREGGGRDGGGRDSNRGDSNRGGRGRGRGDDRNRDSRNKEDRSKDDQAKTRGGREKSSDTQPRQRSARLPERPEELLRRDGRILVKVTKEPISAKGSRVSTDISLAGRFLVLIPAADYVAVSKKIESARERRRLKTLAMSLKPEGFGVIVRTVADGRDAKALDTDLRLLYDKWRKIEQRMRGAEAPVSLYEDVSMVSSIIRDLFTEDYDRILIDDPKLHANVRAYVQAVAPHMADRVQLHRSNTAVFRACGIEKAVEEVFSTRVSLPSGGYLFIETTEAMHVVDVNSGRAGRGKSQAENLLAVNLEAAREVAKQLRLRDLGGIIVVDFIDMRSEGDRRKVYQELKTQFSKDRAVTKLLPMSDFGLVEITRQRLRPSITTKADDEGDGSVRDAASAMAAAGAAEIPQPDRDFGPETLDAPTTPEAVTDRLAGWLQRYRAEVSEKYRDRPIVVRVHPLFGAHLRKGFPSVLTRLRFRLRGLRFRLDSDAALHPLDFEVCDEKSGKSLTSQYEPAA